MKIIKDWLETIEDNLIRKSAIHNMYMSGDNIYYKTINLPDAINFAFTWEDTEEGNYFWCKYYDYLYDIK